jgi:hypothetical protein
MGALTIYLQNEFFRLCPEGWTAYNEKKLLCNQLQNFLGYGPRVDVVLEKNDGSERLWIEFEVSRADPVANHTKFATSHLFQPQSKEDAFISMISPHVTRGRRNLAANTIFLMRNIGMNAFQTVLFPNIGAIEVKRINHLSQGEIINEKLDVKSELERIFVVSRSAFSSPSFRIYFVGDILEVMLNIHSWNEDVSTDNGQLKWGKRTVTYFAYDPRTKLFAPAKFCAYTVILLRAKENLSDFQVTSYSKMTIKDYVRIDASNGIFDGMKAWMHLTKNLGMVKTGYLEIPAIKSFEKWRKRNKENFNLHPNGPIFIVPPSWFKL